MHETAYGPKLPFTAMQRYVRSWSTSRHGADIVSVPPQTARAYVLADGGHAYPNVHGAEFRRVMTSFLLES